MQSNYYKLYADPLYRNVLKNMTYALATKITKRIERIIEPYIMMIFKCHMLTQSFSESSILKFSKRTYLFIWICFMTLILNIQIFSECSTHYSEKSGAKYDKTL